MHELGIVFEIQKRVSAVALENGLELRDIANVVVEVGGPGTLERSLLSVRTGGRIAYIGVLTGLAGAANPMMLIPRLAAIHGIFVGSRQMFADMLQEAAVVGRAPVFRKVMDL